MFQIGVANCGAKCVAKLGLQQVRFCGYLGLENTFCFYVLIRLDAVGLEFVITP